MDTIGMQANKATYLRTRADGHAHVGDGGTSDTLFYNLASLAKVMAWRELFFGAFNSRKPHWSPLFANHKGCLSVMQANKGELPCAPES
jgi:hypothetical protein